MDEKKSLKFYLFIITSKYARALQREKKDYQIFIWVRDQDNTYLFYDDYNVHTNKLASVGNNKAMSYIKYVYIKFKI
jgi:hypothetical protein